MLRLNEFRILYPQYNDMTDYELSTALHQKGFANVPYEQFAREFGGPLEEDKVGAYVRQYNRQNPDAPITKEDVPDRSGIMGGIQLLGEGIYDAVTDTLPDSVARMWRGGDVGTGERGWTDDVIAQQRKDQQRRIMSRQEIEGDTLATSLYQGPQSVATSLATGIAGSLIGGVAGSAIPGVGNVAGAAIGAAGMTLPLFYRMAKDQFVEEVQDAYTKQTGHVLSAEDAAALNAAIDQDATEFGLWEAGPEALSQLFTVGLIGGAGGRVLKALGLGRMSEAIGKRAITRIPAKLGADVAEEEVTEGMTFMGQEGLRQEYGLRETAPTIGEFAREQAGPVAVGSLLQMGVMGAGQKIHDSRLRKGILGALPDDIRANIEDLSTPELRRLGDLVGQYGAASDASLNADRVVRGNDLGSPLPPTIPPEQAVNPGSAGEVFSGPEWNAPEVRPDLAAEWDRQARERGWEHVRDSGRTVPSPTAEALNRGETVDLLNPPADNGGEKAGGGMSVPQPQSVPAEEIAPAPMPEAAQGIGAGLADIHAPAPQVELVTPNALTPYQQQMLEQAERESAGSPIAQGIAPFLSDQDYFDTENFVRETEGRQAAEDARAYANDFWTNAGFGDYVNRPASMLPNWPTGPRPEIAPPAAQPAQTTTPEAVQPPTQAQATPAPAAQTVAEPRPAPVEESPEMTERREELLAYFPAKKRDDMRGMSIEQLEDAVKELYAAQGEQPAPDGSTLHGPHDTYIKRGGRWTAIDNQTGEVRPFDATTNVAVENIWQGYNDTEGKSVKQQRTEILNQFPKEKQEKYKRLGLPNLKEILAEQKKEDTAFVEQALSGGRKNIQVGQEEEPAPQIVGEIDDEIAQTLPLKKKGKIVLDNEGLQHIEDRHGKELRGLGFKGGRDFVDYVLENKDAVYAEPKVTRKYDIVSRVRKPQSRVMIRLEFSENGDFYKIETAGTVRNNFYDKRQPLWESANLNHSQEGTPDATSGQSGVENNISSPAAEGKSADGRDYGTHDAPDTVALADHFAEQFMQGKRYKTIVEARRDVGKLLGGAMPKGQALKAVDEAVELGVVKAARQTIADMRADGKADVDIFRALVDLYQRQPNLGTRTSTSVAEQAYSTPVPLSFLASRLARIGKNSRVYEPTAGNGSLLIEVSPGNATVNELNGGRAERLRSQGFTVTQKDAAQYAPDGKVDVVIENPPFGRVWNDSHTETVELDVDGFTTKEIDQAIVAKSLQALKDNGKGRAVLIIGGKQGGPEARKIKYRAASQVRFWGHLFDNYHILEHFSIDGKLYSRQGASYPIDVIVLDTNGTSAGRTYPGAELPRMYSSFEELEELFNEREMDRAGTSVSSDNAGARVVQEGQGGESGGTSANPRVAPADASGTGRGRAGEAGGERGGEAGSSEGNAEGTAQPKHGARSGREGNSREGLGSDRRPSGRLGSAVGKADDDSRRGLSDSGNQGGKPESGGVGKPDNVGAGRGGLVETQKAGGKPAQVQQKATEFQAPYKKTSSLPSMGTLVPKNMVTAVSNAMKALEKEHGKIDDYVAAELGYKPDELGNYFAAEQIDALGLAIHNLTNGAGFIIGDQTGIGKGRVNAGIIRWAKQHGKTPVFITHKKTLYADMVRDLADIGMEEFNPLPTDAGLSGNEAIPLPDGRTLTTKNTAQHSKLLAEVAENGLGEFDAVFTTYDQLKGGSGPRRRFLDNLAPNAVFILDESHNGGSASAASSRFKKKGEETDSLAAYIRKLLNNCPNGTFYSSATYAKRPDLMDLYSKTDMRFAVNDIKALGEAIARGGIPMQQIVAAELTEAGQYIRRERTWEGADVETVSVKTDTTRADATAEALHVIMEFDRAKQAKLKDIKDSEAGHGGNAYDNKSANEKAMRSASFSSIMHNLIGQGLLAQKVDAIIEAADAAIKRGEKPVIAVSNTMGAPIEEYAESNAVKVGDPIDMTFKDMYLRYLEKARMITKKDKNENVVERRPLTDTELGPEAVKLYNEARDVINESGLDDLPLSIIDSIKNGLRQRGYNVGEITGRKRGIDYSGSHPVLSSVDNSGKSRAEVISGFNGGDIDALILNAAGSTGISLHASEKFKDQRRRTMIIAQPDLNIDVFMQTLGRIFRTGQVVPPKYQLLFTDIPAEKRPAAILAKKMASLNANTTAAKDSDASFKNIPDFMNKYGDKVAVQVMRENGELHERMGSPLDKESLEGSAMQRLTGYIPLLPVKDQQRVYDLLESEYNELIAQHEAMGTLDLEAKTLPLDAKLLREEVIQPAKTDPNVSRSPFAAAAMLGEYDVKRLGHPFSSAKVKELVRQAKPVNVDAEADKMRAFSKERLARIKDEERRAANKERLEGAFSSFNSIIRTFSIGDPVMVSNDQEQRHIPGIVIGIYRNEKVENPLALSSWKMDVAIADAAKKITFPFSQLAKERPEEGATTVEAYGTTLSEAYDAFDSGQSESRQRVYIATGNILSAFERLKVGKVVQFEDHDGNIVPGLMMPKDVSMSELLDSVDLALTPKQSMQFLGRLAPSLGAIKTEDKHFVLTRDDSGYIISVPASKKDGAQYFLNGAILKAAGEDFVKYGQSMVLRDLTAKQATDVLNAMADQGYGFVADNNKDMAREITGQRKSDEKPLASVAPSAHLPPVGKARRGMKADALRRVADKLGSIAKNAATARVVQSFDELPASIREAHKNARTTLEGVFDPRSGAVYLVADNLTSESRAAEVWAHEQVVHHGLRSILTPGERKRLMGNLFIRMGGMGNATIREVAQRYGLDPRKGADARQTVMEEVVASLAERKGKGLLKRADGGAWQRIVDAVRRAWHRLIEAVSGSPSAMNAANIDELLTALGRHVIDGAGNERSGRTAAAEPAYASQGGNREEIGRRAWERLQKDTEEWGRQVDDFMRSTRTRPLLTVSQTPDVLQKLGAPALPMTMTARNLEKVLSDKEDHALPTDIIKQLPGALAEPIMVFESSTVPDSFVVLTELKHGGRSVMAAIHLDTVRQRIRVNDVASAYMRGSEGWYIRQIEDGRLLYKDQKKSLAWARTNGLQLPQVRKLPARLSENRILTDDDVVKPSLWKSAPPSSSTSGEQTPSNPFTPGIPLQGQAGNLQGQRGQSVEKRITPETGEDNTPLASIASSSKAISEQVHSFFSSETVAAGIRQLRKIAGRPVSQDVEEILSNPEEGKLVGKDDIGWFGRLFKLPYWHAKDNAQFRPLYERQQRRTEERMEATNKDIGGMSLLFDRDAKNRLNDKELKQLAAMIHKWDGKQIDSLKDVEKFNVTGQGVNGRDELELNPEYQRGFKQWLKNQPEPERVKQAFQQVRDTLDQEFLKGYRRMAEMNEIADTDLQVYRTEFGSIHNYFPHSREGKYFVTATVGKGVVGDPKQVVFRKHFDVPFGSSVREEWAKIVAANRKNFPGAKWDNPQEVEKLPDDILGAPIDPQAMEQIIKAAAGKVGNKEQSEKIQQLMLSSVSDILKARGWGAHGIQRQNIPGYEMEDIKGVLYKYVSGLNGWLAKMDAARDFAQELGKIDAKKTPRLWEYASTYVKDMLRNSDKVDRFAANVKNVAFAWYLGANFKTAVVNATQNPMVGIPRLDQYCMGAWGGWFKAAADSIGLHYTGQGVEGAKRLTDGEQAMLEDLYGKGIVNAAYMDELQGQLTSSPVLKGWNKFIALLGLPMAKVEVFNRASLALAAYRAAKSGKWRPAAKKQFGFKTGQKLNNEDAAKFAAMIVRDSHFEYGKGNMPEMLRSTWAGRAMSPIYTFRSFGGNMLNLWARALGTERDAGGLRFLAQNLGMTIALGGLTSFPFYATVSALCAAASDDDEDWTAKLRRSVLPKDSTAQNMALYGLPAFAGFTLSGSLRMETFMTEPLAKAKTLKEVMDMTVLNLLGIPYDLVSKVSKANEARKAGNPYRAAEALVPTFAANAMQAYRLATEGNTNLKGKPIGDGEKLSFWDAAGKAAGFQPVSKAESYERYLAGKRADERLGEKRGELAKLFNQYYGVDTAKGTALVRKELKAWNDEMKAQGRESMTLTMKDVVKRAKRERTTRTPSKREKMREQERMARTGS